MAFGINRLAERISNIILYGRNQSMTEREFYELEIGKWRQSPQRIMQIKGQLYYENVHDILTRKRTMIGDDGKLQELQPGHAENQRPDQRDGCRNIQRDLHAGRRLHMERRDKRPENGTMGY